MTAPPLRLTRSLVAAGIVVEPAKVGTRVTVAQAIGLHWIEPTGGEPDQRDWRRWAQRVREKAITVKELAHARR